MSGDVLTGFEDLKPECDDGFGHAELPSRRERFVSPSLFEGISLLLA